VAGALPIPFVVCDCWIGWFAAFPVLAYLSQLVGFERISSLAVLVGLSNILLSTLDGVEGLQGLYTSNVTDCYFGPRMVPVA